jgi:hypothetical protein
VELLLEENPYTRMIIRGKVDGYLREIPEDELVSSNHADPGKRRAFLRYTGLDQATLESWWARGKNLTSCNGFAGIYANAVVPAPKPGRTRNFGMFDLARACQLYGAPEAWIKQRDRPSARPRYGDIVKWNRLHVSVSLDMRGAQWHVAEGGQGGSRSGYDAVRRHWRTYQLAEIEGWVSLVTLFDMHL